MKKIKFLVVIAIVMLFSIMSTIAKAETKIDAKGLQEECFIISIHGTRPPVQVTPAADETPVKITPQYSSFPQGACVVWVNWVRRPQLSISFKNGKACQAATQAPIGFKYAPDSGRYETGYLAAGETSSLRFVEPGTYSYELHIPGRIAPVATGKVTIRKP